MSEMAKLDIRKRVMFSVQAPAEAGLCRVALNQGADRKVLEFEVGAATTNQ